MNQLNLFRASSERPQLIVVVDTEEEFDWSQPPDRSAVGVGHLRRVGEFQEMCERHGVTPVYVVGYPVASQPDGVEALAPLVRDGRALVGSHLHPWVCPPQVEELSSHNSYPGNLRPELEREKLGLLTERIAEAFGVRPVIYKAGRYGLGPNTYDILEDLGYVVDLSVSPPFDYSADGGPDFSAWSVAPAWAGRRQSVLELPGTGALVGRLPSRHLYGLAALPVLRRLRLGGIMARLGLVERLRLSPEGQSLREMRRLTEWLYGRGCRVFLLSLHSPSLEPGHTPFVRNEADQRALLARLECYLDYFMHALNGAATQPLALLDSLRRSEPASERRSTPEMWAPRFGVLSRRP